jgi:hypothetical protein
VGKIRGVLEVRLKAVASFERLHLWRLLLRQGAAAVVATAKMKTTWLG